MAKTDTAPFAQTAKTSSAVVTGADDVTDAPVNTVLLETAGTEGALLTKLTAMPRATVTASSLHLFISQDSGTTKRLNDSALMEAHTVAATTEIPQTVFSTITEDTPIRMEAGDELYVGSGVALAGGIVFASEMTDF
jgi:hypothetical protein